MAPDGGGIELRLALAMRGGVSLSVWIGGACGEIDRLRQAPDGGFWCGLRELAGYSNVIVDVMAGASAGGLNAVIYTASLPSNTKVFTPAYPTINSVDRSMIGCFANGISAARTSISSNRRSAA
jgi:hypothetical protein